jgi:hypothetical protein
MSALRDELSAASPERQAAIREWVRSLNELDLEALVESYLEKAQNPEIIYPDRPSDSPDMPELLRLGPHEILSRLAQLRSGRRDTMNLPDRKVEDVLDCYDCGA